MRLILKYVCSDQYTYWSDVNLPIVAESEEHALLHFEQVLLQRVKDIEDIEKKIKPLQDEHLTCLKSINNKKLKNINVEKEVQKLMALRENIEELKPNWWSQKDNFQCFEHQFNLSNFYIDQKFYLPEIKTLDNFFEIVEKKLKKNNMF